MLVLNGINRDFATMLVWNTYALPYRRNPRRNRIAGSRS
jgi:hypothetical protein